MLICAHIWGKAHLGPGDDADGGVRRVGELGERADGVQALELVLLLLGASAEDSVISRCAYGVHGRDLLVVFHVPLQHLQAWSATREG